MVRINPDALAITLTYMNSRRLRKYNVPKTTLASLMQVRILIPTLVVLSYGTGNDRSTHRAIGRRS